jgi:hypothetical protein
MNFSHWIWETIKNESQVLAFPISFGTSSKIMWLCRCLHVKVVKKFIVQWCTLFCVMHQCCKYKQDLLAYIWKKIKLTTHIKYFLNCIGFIDKTLIKIHKPWNKAHKTWFNEQYNHGWPLMPINLHQHWLFELISWCDGLVPFVYLLKLAQWVCLWRWYFKYLLGNPSYMTLLFLYFFMEHMKLKEYFWYIKMK